jgi:pseudouridine-5'-phosphate glycosidase
MKVQWGSGKHGASEGTRTGILFANPAPAESALPRGEIEAFIAAALRAAETAGVRGKGLTPYLLQEVARFSGGKTLKANIALLVANAALAAQIAVSYHAHA